MIPEVVWAALVGSLPALLALLLALWRFQRMGQAEEEELETKALAQEADATSKLTAAAMQLLEPLQARIEHLEHVAQLQAGEIKELSRKLERSTRLIQALLRGLAVLTDQLKDLGATPAFVIPVYNGDVEYLARVLSEALEGLTEDGDW